MSKILEEMASTYEFEGHETHIEAMRAALLYLADNVSDEMIAAGLQGFYKPPRDFASDNGPFAKAFANRVRSAAISALRQPAGVAND